MGLCPFHEDHDASFAVWQTDDGSELCGCWSCDFRPGDVYHFLQRQLGINFGAALKLAVEYGRDGLPPAPAIPERTIDPNAIERIRGVVASTEGNGLNLLAELLLEKGHPATAEWVAHEFRVGSTGSEIVIPHYARGGSLDAAKWRTLDRKPIAYTGSQLDSLYGAWRDVGRNDVVLCEGESDTWAVAYLLRDRAIDVVGVPSGVTAKPRPEWVEQVRGRNVTILFDADDAGRRGLISWIKALGSGSVRVAMLPEGEDAVSAGSEDTLAALEDAWPVTTAKDVPLKQGRVYVRENAQGNVTEFSDFTLTVQRVVVVRGGGTVFEVTVDGRGDRTYQLPSDTIIDPNKLTRWAANEFLGAWKGGKRESVELLQLLKIQAVTAPRYRGTETIGLHGNTYVLPDCTIGPSGWSYVRPNIETELGAALRLCHGEEWDRAVLAALRDLHSPDIITPLLGWVAAAPLRSLVPQFPIMALVGGAGWGKTTLVQTVLEAFGFWTSSPNTLTSTSPFALGALAGATNAFPIWIDEYRHGARQDAKLTLDQIIRDAWDGSASHKGSVRPGGGLELVSYTASAPLLITGEDGFSETSHAERMVILPIPMRGRNPEALSALREMRRAGLGRQYLRWLVDLLRSDELPHWPERDNRHDQAIAVVEWGWSLLRQFSGELGVEMGACDVSTAHGEFQAMASRSPYEEALREALGALGPDARELAWVEGADVLVRPQALVQFVGRNTDIVLPGSTRAMEAYLSQRWRVVRERRANLRVLRLVDAGPELSEG